MPNTLLTDFQSACRAAHEQAQLLQDLYEHLCEPESNVAAASIDAGSRRAELRSFEEVLAQKARRYFAEAVTPSAIEVVEPDSLDQVEQRQLTERLALALDSMGRSLHRLAGKPLRARVAAEILELSDSDLARHTPDGAAVVHITHDDLATAVGSVRETVTKVIGELVRLGGIRAGYGKITVRDPRVLREVAGE